MATKSTFKPDSPDQPATDTNLNPAPEAETLDQLLQERYDVEKLSDALAEKFVERLDLAVISKIKIKLVNRPAPITVPWCAGNFLSGVGYEN